MDVRHECAHDSVQITRGGDGEDLGVCLDCGDDVRRFIAEDYERHMYSEEDVVRLQAWTTVQVDHEWDCPDLDEEEGTPEPAQEAAPVLAWEDAWPAVVSGLAYAEVSTRTEKERKRTRAIAARFLRFVSGQEEAPREHA